MSTVTTQLFGQHYWCILTKKCFANPNFITVQVHLKQLEYHEKGQYFLSLIIESETHILYRFITHRVKYFKPLFLEILMIMAYRKFEYFIRSIKKG